MIVEFVGMEGAGKTTAVREASRTLADRDTAEAVDLGSVATPRGTAVLALHPRLALGFALADPVDSDSRRRLFTVCRRSHGMSRLPRDGHIFLVDEGPRHRLIGLAASGRVGRPHHLFDALSRVDMIAVCKAEPEVAAQRLRNLGEHHWASRYDDSSLAQRLELYGSWARRLLARSRVPVVWCEPGEEAHRLLEQVRNAGGKHAT